MALCTQIYTCVQTKLEEKASSARRRQPATGRSYFLRMVSRLELLIVKFAAGISHLCPRRLFGRVIIVGPYRLLAPLAALPRASRLRRGAAQLPTTSLMRPVTNESSPVQKSEKSKRM